jgi:hypothetical protein
MRNPEITSLFKYRPFNQHSLQSIIDNAVWFSKPSDFNDPFDCGFMVDEKRLRENVNYALQKICSVTGKNITKLDEENFSIRETDIEAFLKFQKSVYNLFQNSGIFSLSQINNDILMWGHYADSHRGFCIQYERSPNNPLGKAEPVEYQDNIPSLTIKDVTSDGNGIDKLWLTKSTHWSYEKEWRVIEPHGGNSFQFPCVIKSIIFGIKMSDKNKYTIQNILKNEDVILKQATQHTEKFVIEIINI